ncbi:rhodanese-like domain-containing protein [Candidatus Dependentiae bacterium]|nr:rhodanese-like domain-containing protein [Candidatus Dependentiae bacterium]
MQKMRIIGIAVAVALVTGCDFVGSNKPVVINVLEAAYYNDAHIPGSVNVSLDDLPEYAKKLSKNQPIVTYCANYACTASGHAAQQFVDLGFNNVYAYEAGTADWVAQGYPIEGAAQEAYLTMDNKPLDGHTDATQYKIITTDALATLLGIEKKGSSACGCGTVCH